MRPSRIYFHLFSSLVFLINVNALQAQISDVHLDGSFNLDYFTNHGDVNIDTPDYGFAIRVGLNWKLKKYENLTLGFEGGFSQRSIVRKLGQGKSEIMFRALDFCPILRWNIHPYYAAEFGLGFSLYDPALYVNNGPVKLGEGFKNHDIYGTVGGLFSFTGFAAVGTRVRYGFIPALKYNPIGNYGEMNKEESVLNQLTWELFLRIRFYHLKND